MALTATVKRGNFRGVTLHPHKHADGMYVVSAERFEKDYVRVASLDEVERLVGLGLGCRMSNPAAGVRASSLVAPASITRSPALA